MFDEQDKALIQELGLDKIGEEQQTAALASYYNALQTKVGMAVEDKLTDEQLAEFEKVSGAGDDEATAKWLKEAVGDYDQIVAAEAADLKKSIVESADNFRNIVSQDS